jgi:hypothetical protein
MSGSSGLFYVVHAAMGMNQREIGEFLGYSRRTIVRWTRSGISGATDADWCKMARAVHAKNPELARQAAKAAGETLESLGLVTQAREPARPPLTTADRADLAVYAAAEAMATSPQAVRPALLAALDRMTAVGLASDELREALRAVTALTAQAPQPTPPRKTAKKG